VFGFSNTSSWLRYDIPQTNATPSFSGISLGFRTTLTSGVLFSSPDVRMVLALHSAAHIVLYIPGVPTLVVTAPPMTVLNDAAWHQISFVMTALNLSLLLDYGNCPKSPVVLVNQGRSMQMCETTLSLNQTFFNSSFNGSNFASGLNTVYFGGGASLKGSVTNGYVGCMRDISVNSVTLASSSIVADTRVSNGVLGVCTRGAPPCFAVGVCQARGQCVDLWNQYTCVCVRPYYGPECQYSKYS